MEANATVKFCVFEEDGHKEKTEAMDVSAIRTIFFFPGARSRSPKQRKGPDSV